VAPAAAEDAFDRDPNAPGIAIEQALAPPENAVLASAAIATISSDERDQGGAGEPEQTRVITRPEAPRLTTVAPRPDARRPMLESRSNTPSHERPDLAASMPRPVAARPTLHLRDHGAPKCSCTCLPHQPGENR
jgi:hypothetical protein